MEIESENLGLEGGETCNSPQGVEQVDIHPGDGGDLQSTNNPAVESRCPIQQTTSSTWASL
jgi:hypothetical protein